MAMEPRYTDEVRVVLEAVKPASSDRFSDRHIFLTKNRPSLDVGRSTKRDARLVAGPSNGWFDSPVMSRNHARLILSPKDNTVGIVDIGSLHGTYLNNSRLCERQPRKICSDDIIRFGIPIEKGVDVFQPCQMKVKLKYGLLNPKERPVVFKVPDSTDEEESVSGIDDAVDTTVALLQKAGVTPSRHIKQAIFGAIDLTGDDTPVVREIMDLTMNQDKPDELIIENQFPCEDISPQCASGEADGADKAREAVTSPHNSNSSIMFDTDEEALSYMDEDFMGCDVDENNSGLHRDSSSVSKSPRHLRSSTDCSHSESDEDDNNEFPSISEVLSEGLSERGLDLDDRDEKLTNVATSPTMRVEDLPTAAFATPSGNGCVSADDLGAKSGKAEYFAARAYNRRAQLDLDNDSENDAQYDVDDIVEDDGLASFACHASILSGSAPQTCISTADLLASGEKFLQSPIDDNDTQSEPAQEDLLDDTSAFTYEMSKRAAGLLDGSPVTVEMKETQKESNSVEEEHLMDQSPMSHLPSKRKAEEISALLPNEIEPNSSQTQLETAVGAPSSAPTSATSVEVSDNIFEAGGSTSVRPAKRLRRAAEVFGYAALGGVAVMSALIATAPVL
ncbi:hypothetical protein QQS21_007143 [Conoideocrella luteorostrata]|uniref:FHA domain-containing protein n=1 Tax=Conoideocrella luteorostrata TaxID=1105319 RepID=A0AAJ0CP57_9HYPO|nr:hypothetical protein QQS21_007143 [Conoideocrella luteorostrata]